MPGYSVILALRGRQWRINFLKALVVFPLLLSIYPSTWWRWSGPVVHICDGDTITVLRGSERVRVRLYGIDTPERSQPSGENAAAFMSAQVFDKVVEIRKMDVDRYKRIVAVVSVGDLNINRLLVEYGYAWVYDRYCKAEFCAEWKLAEAEAREAKRGLWKNPKAVPPWEYRRSK
ncbi:MAG: thermonuclease family protein [Deltaproteobacteria bacterium]|nr:thermonuclease family protein [Deltaproteobacteria bacterium]